ncbi:hypothetical protein CVT26_000997 [Gymnopilus dilepis]|uniref:Uncharacterized protein n=1 Tax=Gymnopilus dilepis TaxID=231916 RepID=A0A409YL86_9AGAR|nr:hypothetical protein CVT26_000997 [Gymnopilus dilepis]
MAGLTNRPPVRHSNPGAPLQRLDEIQQRQEIFLDRDVAVQWTTTTVASFTIDVDGDDDSSQTHRR